MNKQLRALVGDDELMARITHATSLEEASTLLAESGVAMSAKELAKAAQGISTSKNDELDVEELDRVAGGYPAPFGLWLWGRLFSGNDRG